MTTEDTATRASILYPVLRYLVPPDVPEAGVILVAIMALILKLRETYSE